jgi:hypothetical protein
MALFMPIVNKEVLLSLTKDNRTAFLLDKIEIALLERSLLLLPRIG